MALTGYPAALQLISEVIKTAAYSVVDNDMGALLLGNSASNITFSLPAVAGRDGFSLTVKNVNATGILTLDPNSTELIEGATTYSLGQNESVTIYCNGSAWRILGNNNGLRASQNLAELPSKPAARVNLGVDVAIANVTIGGVDSTTNLNSITTAGWYQALLGTTNANLPVTPLYGYLHVASYVPNCVQMFYEYPTAGGATALRVWVRGIFGGSWTNWKLLQSSDDGLSVFGQGSATNSIPTASQLTKYSATFIAKTTRMLGFVNQEYSRALAGSNSLYHALKVTSGAGGGATLAQSGEKTSSIEAGAADYGNSGVMIAYEGMTVGSQYTLEALYRSNLANSYNLLTAFHTIINY